MMDLQKVAAWAQIIGTVIAVLTLLATIIAQVKPAILWAWLRRSAPYILLASVFFVIGTLFGSLSTYLPTTSPPTVKIRAPASNDQIDVQLPKDQSAQPSDAQVARFLVSGVSSNVDANSNVYVLVRAVNPNEDWWVEGPDKPDASGYWTVTVYDGHPEVGKTLQVMAIVAHNAPEGKQISNDDMTGLALARSDTVTLAIASIKLVEH